MRFPYPSAAPATIQPGPRRPRRPRSLPRRLAQPRSPTIAKGKNCCPEPAKPERAPAALPSTIARKAPVPKKSARTAAADRIGHRLPRRPLSSSAHCRQLRTYCPRRRFRHRTPAPTRPSALTPKTRSMSTISPRSSSPSKFRMGISGNGASLWFAGPLIFGIRYRRRRSTGTFTTGALLRIRTA